MHVYTDQVYIIICSQPNIAPISSTDRRVPVSAWDAAFRTVSLAHPAVALSAGFRITKTNGILWLHGRMNRGGALYIPDIYMPLRCRYQYDFGSPQPVTAYDVWGPHNMDYGYWPYTWRLEGSDDGRWVRVPLSSIHPFAHPPT